MSSFDNRNIDLSLFIFLYYILNQTLSTSQLKSKNLIKNKRIF